MPISFKRYEHEVLSVWACHFIRKVGAFYNEIGEENRRGRQRV